MSVRKTKGVVLFVKAETHVKLKVLSAGMRRPISWLISEFVNEKLKTLDGEILAMAKTQLAEEQAAGAASPNSPASLVIQLSQQRRPAVVPAAAAPPTQAPPPPQPVSAPAQAQATEAVVVDGVPTRDVVIELQLKDGSIVRGVPKNASPELLARLIAESEQDEPAELGDSSGSKGLLGDLLDEKD